MLCGITQKAVREESHGTASAYQPASSTTGVFKERDTTGMRKLYGSCEAHNRALKALGVKEETYSAIVVPCVMEKLPEHFRLTITRDNNFLEWSIEEILKAFEKELREAHNGVGTNTERIFTKETVEVNDLVNIRVLLRCMQTGIRKSAPSA